MSNLVIYGLGAIGSRIVDELLEEGHSIELILDRGKRGQNYQGIPIVALEDAPDRVSGKSVLIGLHNHYVDLNQLHSDLIAAGAERVMTPLHLREFISRPRTQPGYWLDFGFDYDAHQSRIDGLRALLADERSRELLDQIVRYRRTGDLEHCPVPSLDDEYTPADLPRYASPLRLIDCGAFTGVAIHKFLKAGYAIDSWHWQLMANSGLFDPDLPLRDYPAEAWERFLYQEPTKIKVGKSNLTFEGLVAKIKRQYLGKDPQSLQSHARAFAERAIRQTTCPECAGVRLI